MFKINNQRIDPDIFKNNIQKQNSKIQQLIDEIINDNDLKIYIKKPDNLIASLNELNNIIGNDDIKNDIYSQIKYLITEIKENKSNKNMLNTVIYGPPGTGKTSIAIIMAKIWDSLGFLGNKKPIDFDYILTEIGKDKLELYIASFALLLTYLFSFLSFVYKLVSKFNYKIRIFIFILFVILCFLVYTYLKDIIFLYINNINKSDTSMYKIVSREDFVDRYVGHTDKKTNALLNSNIGKVLIIDEAYSLVNDERDCFGAEALTALNRFLSENPGKIFIIMAGYKDLLKNGIFKIQPGLPRRFMWHFECPGYNYNELYDIFNYHIKKDGWKIKEDEIIHIKNMFEKNFTIFKSFGGDIEKLIFFAKLDHNDNNCPSKLLDFFNIKSGMVKLLNNNVY